MRESRLRSRVSPQPLPRTHRYACCETPGATSPARGTARDPWSANASKCLAAHVPLHLSCEPAAPCAPCLSPSSATEPFQNWSIDQVRGLALLWIRRYLVVPTVFDARTIHRAHGCRWRIAGLRLRPTRLRRRFKPLGPCLLYTSPSPRDGLLSRMPSSA